MSALREGINTFQLNKNNLLDACHIVDGNNNQNKSLVRKRKILSYALTGITDLIVKIKKEMPVSPKRL